MLYSVLFAVAGAMLLAFTYVLVANSDQALVREPSVVPPVVPEDGLAARDRINVSAYVEQRIAGARAEQLRDLLVQSGVALAVMTVLSVALGWLMAGRVLAPLRTMTEAARRISADNLHARLAVAGPDDELKAMADTFDDVLARLEGAFEAQKQFVANASHELRTPLTLQQAIVDVTLSDPDASVAELREACARVRAAGQEQERLIDALLTLARSQRGLQERELVDLAEVVRERVPVRALEAASGSGPASAQGPRIEVDLRSAPVLGDPQLIERLVVNLAENAVRHNRPEGEERWVRVWTGWEGGGPVLRIVNSGPVIPADQVEGLFQPFRRVGVERARSREGLGLGLSIVAAIAAAHGGVVDARARGEGGLWVEVGFPPPPPLPVPRGCSPSTPRAIELGG